MKLILKVYEILIVCIGIARKPFRRDFQYLNFQQLNIKKSVISQEEFDDNRRASRLQKL